jgi:hypothetical protein
MKSKIIIFILLVVSFLLFACSQKNEGKNENEDNLIEKTEELGRFCLKICIENQDSLKYVSGGINSKPLECICDENEFYFDYRTKREISKSEMNNFLAGEEMMNRLN